MDGDKFQELSTMAISLLVFCIIIGLTFIIMDKFVTQTDSTVATANESWAAASNTTAYTLLKDYAKAGTVTMYNSTSNVLLLTTNFTEVSDNTGYTGSVVLSSSALASEWGMPMRVVYSYYTGQARTAVTTTANATATLPTWLPIIIIIAIAVIILGLVIRMKVVGGSGGFSGPAQFDEYY